jgi:hypothetical protein
MRRPAWLVPVALLVCGVPSSARAGSPVGAPFSRFGDFLHGPAFEVDVLGPFIGIGELKILVPVLRRDRARLRGELVFGVYLDYAWRLVRDASAGKVGILAAKLGYRQFFAWGLHVEVSANLGWREERDNPYDHTTLESFAGRLWVYGGWQVELTPAIYLNLRGGPGFNLFRVGDPYADRERAVAGGGDLNLGFRF